MNVRCLSDLHFEFEKDGGEVFINAQDTRGVDILVLAGDVGTVKNLGNSLIALCEKYKGIPIVYVPGNHEWYDAKIGQLGRILSYVQKEYSNFHWFRNEAKVINRIKFIAGTMWFRWTPECSMFQSGINDSRAISDWFMLVRAENERFMKVLDQELDENSIVVTHHAPTWKSVSPYFVGAKLNCFYVNDCADLILGRNPKLWIHGHMHESFNYRVGETLVVANPRGYVGYEENPAFDPNILLDLEKINVL